MQTNSTLYARISPVSWDDCGWMLPEKLHVSSFPDRFSHYARTAAYSAHSNFIGSRVYACLGVTCHLHFWQNERGLLRSTAVTQGWNGQRTKSKSANKVNSGEENSPAASAGIRTRNLLTMSLALSPTSYPNSNWKLPSKVLKTSTIAGDNLGWAVQLVTDQPGLWSKAKVNSLLSVTAFQVMWLAISPLLPLWD